MPGQTFVHVPYKGVAPALTDLLGGQIHFTFGSIRQDYDSWVKVVAESNIKPE